MKLCIECQNFRPQDVTCGAAPKWVSMVTGKPGGFYYAETERAGHLPGDCGPHALKFVAKTEVVYPTHEIADARH